MKLKNKKPLQSIIEEAFSLDNLFKKTRVQTYVVARSVFFYLSYKEGFALYKVAQAVNLNHATALNARNRFDTYYNYYKEYRSSIDYVISEWAGDKE